MEGHEKHWFNLRNQFMLENKEAEQKDLPKNLRGKLKAKYCPKDDTDWLMSENKAYQRVVQLDAEGFLTYTYMHMEAKWVGGEKNTYKREQFPYIL